MHNDGGRAASGFKGEARDCVCRAISIATGIPYIEVYKGLNEAASSERIGSRKLKKSSARNGVFNRTSRRYMESLGWKWTPTMSIGSGCSVHLSAKELPAGRLVVVLSRHIAAVIDGVLPDTYDCSRGGTRCVYGYFSKSLPEA